jgi:predicted SAM-dependent methyltransferase
MKLLNIACGQRYHKDWINIDFHSDSRFVKKMNILSGLPFESNSMDAVYCGHFLEHIDVEECKIVLSEIYRVLKPAGVIRVVVPDLENICREYLKILELALVNEDYLKKHEWITTELFDQMVRNVEGGKMKEIFNKVSIQQDVDLAGYIKERTGDELLAEGYKHLNKKNRKITIHKIINKMPYIYLKIIKFFIPKNLKTFVFNDTSIGEKHRWMYDRLSLKLLLEYSNFNCISAEKYNSSKIKNFNEYKLDINEDGTPYKGISSLYMEAIK